MSRYDDIQGDIPLDGVRRVLENATINVEAEKANASNVEVAVTTLPTNPTLSESLYKQMKEAEAIYIDRIAEDTRARDKLNEHIKDGEYALRSVRNAIESLEQTAFAVEPERDTFNDSRFDNKE